MQNRRALFHRAPSIVLLLTAGLCLWAEAALADSFDWRTVNGSNWNSTVESQVGGTCWDFSACGCIEAKYMLTRNDPNDLPDVSEEMVDWETAPDMGSTGGGNGEAVLSYFTTHGVMSYSDVPWVSSSNDVGVAPYWTVTTPGGWRTDWASRVYKTTSNVNQITNVTATMKTDLKLYGPLEVGCTAGNDLFASVADVEKNYRGPVNSEDHEVSLVGYVDDTKVPSGGYWIIKNSWGYNDNVYSDYVNNGYYLIPYGDIEVHNDISAITGSAYYTGAMKSVTWTGSGSSGAVWTTNTATGYRNWSDGAAWVNQETAATFDSSSSHRAVVISNAVVAHQMIISATGYSFSDAGSGASLTITAGGIQANQSVTINVPVTVGAPQTWTVASSETLDVNAALHTIISNLTVAGSGNTIIGGPIDGGGVLNTMGAAPGNLTNSGGTLTLNGASNYPGTISVNAGVVNLAPLTGSTATYSGSITLAGGGTLTLAPQSGSTVTCSGAMTSYGTLQKTGQGTAVLAAASPYFTGPITVSQGQLTVNNLLGLGASMANVVLNGGQLNYNVGGTISRSFTISGSSVLNQMSGNATYSGVITCSGSAEIRNSGGGAMTINNPISGNMGGGGLTLNGISGNAITLLDNINVSNNSGVTFSNGTVLLGGSANSWAGGATVVNATLKPTAANSLPSGTTFTLNGGTLDLGGCSQSIAGLSSLAPTSDLVTSSTACTLTVTPAADMTYAGQLGGAINLTKNGAATLILSGNNNALSSSVTTTIGGGTLQIGGGGTTGSIAGNVAINSGALAFARSDNLTYSGNISGASGSLVQQGSGTLTLTGTNTYGNGTTVNNGTLQIGSGGAVGSITGDVAINSGTLCFDRSDNLTFSSNISGAAGSVVKQASNNLTLTGTNTYGNGTTICAGTLTVGNGGAVGSIAGDVAINAGTLCFARSDNVTFSGNISGAAGSLLKQGSNNLTLTGADNCGNGTTVNGGTLTVGNGGTTGSIAGNVAVNAALLVFSRSDDVSFGGNISGATGKVIKQGSNNLTLTGMNNYGNGTTINGGTLTVGNGATAGSIGGSVMINSGKLAFARTDNVTFAGNIAGPAGSLLQQGPGTLTLTGAATCGGETINGGTLQIGGGGTTGSIAGNVTINGGTLCFARSDNVTYAGNVSGASGNVVQQGPGTLTLTGAVACAGETIGGGTLQVGNGGTTGSLGGPITDNATLAFYLSNNTSCSDNIGGNGGLTKYGANRLTLTGANSYGGRTVVAGGTLELAATAQNSILTLGGADVQTGKIVFDYAGATDPAATIQGLLSYSCDNGQWDRGQFRDTTAAATGLTLGVYDDTAAKTVTVMATYAGDFNLDGVVDNQDKALWLAHAFTGTTWQQGDANGDGVVNGLDLDLWRAHYGLSTPLSGELPSSSAAMPSTVPEPGTLALLAVCLLGLLAYARRFL